MNSTSTGVQYNYLMKNTGIYGTMGLPATATDATVFFDEQLSGCGKMS